MLVDRLCNKILTKHVLTSLLVVHSISDICNSISIRLFDFIFASYHFWFTNDNKNLHRKYKNVTIPLFYQLYSELRCFSWYNQPEWVKSLVKDIL